MNVARLPRDRARQGKSLTKVLIGVQGRYIPIRTLHCLQWMATAKRASHFLVAPLHGLPLCCKVSATAGRMMTDGAAEEEQWQQQWRVGKGKKKREKKEREEEKKGKPLFTFVQLSARSLSWRGKILRSPRVQAFFLPFRLLRSTCPPSPRWSSAMMQNMRGILSTYLGMAWSIAPYIILGLRVRLDYAATAAAWRATTEAVRSDRSFPPGFIDQQEQQQLLVSHNGRERERVCVCVCVSE
ncbi:hypothetical protein LX32DRAFT_153512 [Colletotrichum zoysiae]|uniref:Uncharacterized protein n=1 Tax=Colletotrichum zoysiae TaxID=1216348 RepID=A0AAD9HUN8_9PEZI|nr:hypothetical protein LX32DRAFT_153512 [Colletotrichum zoysiae]